MHSLIIKVNPMVGTQCSTLTNQFVEADFFPERFRFRDRQLICSFFSFKSFYKRVSQVYRILLTTKRFSKQGKRSSLDFDISFVPPSFVGKVNLQITLLLHWRFRYFTAWNNNDCLTRESKSSSLILTVWTWKNARWISLRRYRTMSMGCSIQLESRCISFSHAQHFQGCSRRDEAREGASEEYICDAIVFRRRQREPGEDHIVIHAVSRWYPHWRYLSSETLQITTMVARNAQRHVPQRPPQLEQSKRSYLCAATTRSSHDDR